MCSNLFWERSFPVADVSEERWARGSVTQQDWSIQQALYRSMSIQCHKTLLCIHSTEPADGDVRTRSGISLRLPCPEHGHPTWRSDALRTGANWGAFRRPYYHSSIRVILSYLHDDKKCRRGRYNLARSFHIMHVIYGFGIQRLNIAITTVWSKKNLPQMHA